MSSSIDRSSASPAPRKRPREVQEDDGPIATRAKKLKRRKTSKKAKDGSFEDMDIEKGLNNAVGRMDNQLLADFLAQQTKRHGGDLSTIELQDMYLPANAFHDASTWSSSRVTDNLPQFLREHIRTNQVSLSKAPTSKGTPHTIVVTSAGLRAADMARALRIFQTKESAVMKLFAKHIKLREAIAQVKKTRMGIGIGTPTRLMDLLDADALKTEGLVTIMIDGSHIDQKRRGIFDMKETHIALMKLLARPELRDRYGTNSKKVEILVF